jgi:hypothetical protein
MYPRLRSQLRAVHEATQPPNEDTDSLEDRENNFQHGFRGRGNGRGRGGRGRGRGPWTQERGTENGLNALRRAKQEYGKGGEGVRDFADLVLKLVVAHNQSLGAPDATELVQQEVAEENARIISQLLNGEGY